MMTSSSRRRWFAAATLMLGLGVGLGVAEAIARFQQEWVRQHREPPEEVSLLETNPHGTGSYRLKPDLNLLVEAGPYRIPIQTNRHGMRWREVSKEKTDRRRRVALMGDSFTFGSWANSVENSLAGVFDSSVSPQRWEVLNYGVGGYGFGDIELQLREDAVEFDLDYVILVSFNGNDFRDTYLGVDKDQIIDGVAVGDESVLARKIPAEARGEDRSTSRPSPPRSRWQAALQKLVLFQLAAPYLRMEHLDVEFNVNQRFLSYSYWSQAPYPEVALAAKNESLATLSRIHGFLAERGIRLAIVSLPTRDQVYSRVPYGAGFDIDYPQVYVKLWAHDHGVAYLDLLPVFREHVSATNENLYVKRDTHFNNVGHRLAGWHMSEWFRCCVKTQNLPESDAEVD